jgi:hypothetical protein
MKAKLKQIIITLESPFLRFSPVWGKSLFFFTFITLVSTSSLLLVLYFNRLKPLKLVKAPTESSYVYAAYDDHEGFSALISEKNTNLPKVKANFRGGANAEFMLKGLSDKLKKPRKLSNRITFSDVKPNIDLTYETLPNGIKEEIILNEAPESNQFDFTLSTVGATPNKVTETGYGTNFSDSEGNYLFHLADPFAIDASGNRTDTAYYLVQEASPSGTFEVSLFVNNDWLTSEERTYPIVIDPTIIYDDSSEFAAGQFNRAKDTGGGSSPKLETYYQGLPVDQYTSALWRFNDTFGSSVVDSSGNNNTGTANGTTGAVGLINNAKSFNGSTDYISIPSSTNLDFGSGDFTFEWWEYRTEASGGGEMVFARDNRASSTCGYLFGHNSLVYISSPTGCWDIANARTLGPTVLNSWQHLAIVRNGSNFTTYRNGVPQDTWYSDLPVSSGTSAATIGGWSYSNPNPSYNFSGLLDEMRVTKGYARTPEEIRLAAQRRPYSVYTSGVLDFASDASGWNPFTWTEFGATNGNGETLKDSTNLIAQWNFNNNAGTAAPAIAGSCGGTCQGTLVNFANTTTYDALAMSGWTLYNAKWTYALMFDGVDDYVTAGPVVAGTPGNESTEIWFKPMGNGTILVECDAAACNAYNYTKLSINSDGSLIAHLWNLAGTLNLGKVTYGQWYHAALTYDGTTFSAYLNGKFVASKTGARSAPSAMYYHFGQGSPQCGGGFDSCSVYFKGIIDSTRYYSRVLTAGEIMANYAMGNLEFQTRTGADNTPDDGSWEAWKPVTGETNIDSLDSFTTTSTAENNLVSYWPMSEPSGAVAQDTKGGNNGTVTGTAIEEGYNGFARRNGGAGYITINDAANLDLTGDFTAMAWVSRNGGTNGYILSKFGSPGGGGYALLHGNNGEVYCRTDNGTNYTDSYTAGGKVTNATSWTHVAIVRTGSSCRVFINGTDQTTTANTHATVAANALPLKIFVDTANATPFIGKVDEVRLFNAALSAADIQKYMNGGTHPLNLSVDTNLKMEGTGSLKVETGKHQTDASTVGLWHLEETGGSGAYLTDSSGRGYHATPTSTAVANGISGKGRSYSGAGNNLSVADTAALKPGTITLEAWFKTSTNTVNPYDGGTIILDKINTASPFQGYRLSNGGNKLNCWVGSGTYTTGTSLVNDNKWHHGACTYDGEDVKVYVDGKLENSMPHTAVLSYATPLLIGNAYTGLLDEVRISNIARTDAEIADSYRMGSDLFFSKTISSTNLSAVSSVPFYVAADRPGTYLTTMLGETAFANYQTDGNTLGLWHLEEDQKAPTLFDYDSFENSLSADNWSNRNSTDPDITQTTAYTGKSSLHMPLSFGRNFESGSGEPTTGFDTNTYPYMCMAYKIPSSTIANMLILNNGAWRSITMTQGESQPSYPKAATWNPLTVDNEWHHKCINLDAQMDAIDGAGAHSITAVIWHTGGAATAITGEFWIDDFSISNLPYYPQQGFSRDESGPLQNSFFAPIYTLMATGGTTSTANNYNVHSFTSSGTFTITNGPGVLDALLIGGGGGGANTGSGGGAGGVVIDSAYLAAGAYAATVGAGGAGGATTAAPGVVGNNTVFGNSIFTALGGGRGVSHGGSAGGNGGSGGGGSITTSGGTPAGGTGSQGFNGGAGYVQASWVGNSGGGGGAGTPGVAGGNTAGTGAGGQGLTTSMTGVTTYYAGGGGAGEVMGSYVGAGGTGGGGTAVVDGAGGAGAANTGGGGAGGSYTGTYFNGGNGGSGRIDLRYPNYKIHSLSNAIGTTTVQGKIGQGKYFSGSDNLDLGTNFPTLTNNFTISVWVNPVATQNANANIFGNHTTGFTGMVLQSPSTTNQYFFTWGNGTGWPCWNVGSGITLQANTWQHVAITKSSTAGITYYLNGQAVATCSDTSAVVPASRDLWLGQGNPSSAGTYFTGSLDEFRVDNTVRSAEQIRQAFEFGNRSHPVTIDFGAKLDASNLIADSADLTFKVDGTIYGGTIYDSATKLYKGDKVIVRENYNGTVYTAQGIAITNDQFSSIVTVSSWDAGSTFPPGGFTINADVFKWQREYFNVSASNIYHRDGITQLTFRVSGHEGRTLWIDDLKSANYLTNPAGSTLDSTGNRYFQFRVINTASDYNISPWLTSVTADFQTLAPNPPTMGNPSNVTTNSVQWNFTDNASNETGVKVYDLAGSLKATCVGVDITSCTETGLVDSSTYTRRIVAYNDNGNSLYSGNQTAITLAAVPNAPIVSGRTATGVNIQIDSTNQNEYKEFAIYMEEGSTCDGVGGSYVLLNNEMWWYAEDWGIWGVSGLNPNKAYVFCAKARNISEIESAFGPPGAHNAGYVPISGDFVYSTDNTGTNTFVNRYPDGYVNGRYVIAVDNAGSPNAAKFEVKSGILTVNSTDTLATGELILTGGSIAIADGGQVKIGEPVWIVDADADGYSSDGKLYVGTQPAGGRRKTVAATMSANDCADNTYSPNNNCFLEASGGTITYSGNYKIHTFTSNGTFAVTSPAGSYTVEYLVVGGGGGSGGGQVNVNYPAGGGGGAALTGTVLVGNNNYPIVIGQGGAYNGADMGTGGTGGTTSAIGNVALGGQGGYFRGHGGASYIGYAGGVEDSGVCAAGGGGNAGAGENAQAGRGGNGGNGSPFTITGSTIYVSGGGAGMCGVNGTNGLGGGNANYGGGGGPAQAGGNGLAVLRYLYQ